MSKDIITAGPSRRSIAKGAAWAVPAVSVAAAAPSLAASVAACALGTLQVTANCPPLLSTDSLTFTVTNPTASGCEVAAGTVVDITVGGLVGLTLEQLVILNAGVLYQEDSTLALSTALGPGDSITLEIFPPSLLNAQVAGTATVAVDGSSASANYIIAEVLGLTVAICA